MPFWSRHKSRNNDLFIHENTTFSHANMSFLIMVNIFMDSCHPTKVLARKSNWIKRVCVSIGMSVRAYVCMCAFMCLIFIFYIKFNVLQNVSPQVTNFMEIADISNFSPLRIKSKKCLRSNKALYLITVFMLINT